MWKKRLVVVAIVLGVVGLLVYQLIGEAGVQCRVCVTFKGQRKCGTAVGPGAAEAKREAQNTACSQMTQGVTESFACPNVEPDEVTCEKR
jgi:hypothetical protein